jgi:glycosyltransferase involved in cell wall biosynthesis
VKVLLVSSSSGSRGGGEIFLRYLGQGLVQREHQVLFWCSEHPRMDEFAGSLAKIGQVVRSSYHNFYDYKTRIVATCLNHGTSRRLASEWEQLGPDVIHVNKQNLEDGLDLLRAANLISIPSLCTVHITQTARFLRARVAWMCDWLARRCLHSYKGPYIAVQETRRRELSDFLGNGHETRTIFNGVPLVALEKGKVLRESKRMELGIANEELLIVGVGRMEAQKRPLLFLELAARLHKRVPQAKFLWVGGGSLTTQWDQWVGVKGLKQIIRRVGWQDDVKPFLFAADLFLHVAEFEGLPFAIIEAMSAGLPCAIPEDMAREVSLFSKKNVFFIEDEDALTRGMISQGERQDKGSRARQLAVDHFSIEKMASEYEKAYATLARK